MDAITNRYIRSCSGRQVAKSKIQTMAAALRPSSRARKLRNDFQNVHQTPCLPGEPKLREMSDASALSVSGDRSIRILLFCLIGENLGRFEEKGTQHNV